MLLSVEMRMCNNFFHGFSKINYKLFTYSEVGVIAL